MWDKDFLGFLKNFFVKVSTCSVITCLKQFPDLLLFLDDFVLKMYLLNKKLTQNFLDSEFLEKVYGFICQSQVSMRHKEELHSGLQRLLKSEVFSAKDVSFFLENFLKIIVKSCQLDSRGSPGSFLRKSNFDSSQGLMEGDSIEDPGLPPPLCVPNKMSFLVLVKCLDVFHTKNKADFQTLFSNKPYLNFLEVLIQRISFLLRDDALVDERDSALLHLVMVAKKLYEVQVISLNQNWRQKTQKLMRLLLNSLFQIEVDDPQEYPRVKGFKARQVCFNLFLEICNHDSELSLTFLRELVLDYEEFWVESVSTREGLLEFRGPGKSIGLRNLGNTCYVNSILQQFYFIDFFRDALLGLDFTAMTPLDSDMKHVTESLKELQLLFARMQTSSLSSISPEQFCRSFKGMNNQPINPGLQQDAYEFLNCFLDTVEDGFPVEKSPQIMGQFRGTMINEIKSLEEEHPFSSQHPESFLTLLVDVKNCRNLSQALDKLVTQEIMDGDNALFRENLNRKVPVSRQSRFKSFPQTLMLVLKRFEYDQNTFQRVKLNNLFEFPLSLDLQPWTIDCNTKCLYDLKGVVVHSGSAEYGHYYSHILKEKTWYEFNDKRVREIHVNQHLLREEWFGGTPQVNMFTEINFDWPNNSSKNAYILFYERAPVGEPLISQKSDLPHDLKKTIQNENKRILGGMLFADNQFNRFCSSFSEILSRFNLKQWLRVPTDPENVEKEEQSEKIEEEKEVKEEKMEQALQNENEQKILKQFLHQKMMSLYLKIYGFKYEKKEVLDDKAKSAIDQKTSKLLIFFKKKISIIFLSQEMKIFS